MLSNIQQKNCVHLYASAGTNSACFAGNFTTSVKLILYRKDRGITYGSLLEKFPRCPLYLSLTWSASVSTTVTFEYKIK